MKITQLMAKKAEDNNGNTGITIACLGDSVTQGCFELYMKNEKESETIFEQEFAYHAYLKKILAMLYPSVPVNIINAGISGSNAVQGYKRLERDVLRYNPDLVIVCFGLNDSGKGEDGIKEYTDALEKIFNDVRNSGAEVIFMTPNMMNTSISPHIICDCIKAVAQNVQSIQNDGILDKYMEAAKKVCLRLNVTVCDCYEKWKTLYKNGVNVTELLSNKINHPTRDMNWLFAVSLVETIMNN